MAELAKLDALLDEAARVKRTFVGAAQLQLDRSARALRHLEQRVEVSASGYASVTCWACCLVSPAIARDPS